MTSNPRNRERRWTCAATVVCAIVVHAVGSVRADDGPPLIDPTAFGPLRSAAVVDGHPLPENEVVPAVRRTLEYVAETPTATVREDCRRWLKRRRRAIPKLVDDPRARFDVLADVAANPDEHRGQPLIVWGRARSVESVEFDEADEPLAIRVVRIDAFDDPDIPVIAVLPADAPSPEAAGEGVVGAGYFAWLGDGDGRNAPILVCGELISLGDRLDAGLMASVENREFPLTEERDAYLTAIAHARLADEARLREVFREYRAERIKATGFRHEPHEFPAFVDLFKNVDCSEEEIPYANCKAYHGRPVELRGHVWAIHKVPSADTSVEYGYENLYTVMLYDEDSQTNAARIVCTELPEGLPTSGKLEQAVDGISVVGFFYKMEKYVDQANDGRVMPVIVARTVTWRPNAGADIVPRFGPVSYAVVAVVLLGLVGAVWWAGRSDRNARTTTTTAGEPTFDGIDETDPDRLPDDLP